MELKHFLPKFVACCYCIVYIPEQIAKIKNVPVTVFHCCQPTHTNLKPNLVVCFLENMAGPLVENIQKYQDKVMCLTSLQDDMDKLLLGRAEVPIKMYYFFTSYGKQ